MINSSIVLNVPSLLVDSSLDWFSSLFSSLFLSLELWKLNFMEYSITGRLNCHVVLSNLQNCEAHQPRQLLNVLNNTPFSLILTFYGVKEVHYISLSGSRALSSRHVPSGLRKKRFAKVGKQHASTVSRQILNHRQVTLHNHYWHNSYWLLPRKIFQIFI